MFDFTEECFASELENARKGDAEAQNYVIWYLIAHKRDYKSAFIYGEKFAEYGSPCVQKTLGELYCFLGDFENARKWFEKATDGGECDACFDLAGLYGNGWGVTRDTDMQIHLLQKAARMGSIEAREVLEDIG